MKKIKAKKAIFVLLTLVLLGAIFLSGCITLISPTPATGTPNATATPTQVEAINPTWTPSRIPTQVNDELNGVADVVALVKPSVVAINTEVTVDTLFGPTTQEGAGSGWIIDSEGIIVTNYHVVEGATTVTVTLDNGDTYTADPGDIFSDQLTDLAIIKIDATGLQQLNVGFSSDMRVGEFVIAIGNQLGLGISSTFGIISQKDVSLEMDAFQTLYNLIQTDAAINAGNSGGPLVNLAGEVIGITSAKIASVGVEGMGYAISIDAALPIIEELVGNGYVVRPFLGVSLYTVDQVAIREFDLEVDSGVVVLQVSSGSPAAAAGLRQGDVIVSIGGTDVTTKEELTDVLFAAIIGEPLEIRYWRGSTERTTTVIPIEAPRD